MNKIMLENNIGNTILCTEKIIIKNNNTEYQLLSGNTWINILNPSGIMLSDEGNFYTNKTILGAIQEIGSTLSGLEDTLKGI